MSFSKRPDVTAADAELADEDDVVHELGRSYEAASAKLSPNLWAEKFKSVFDRANELGCGDGKPIGLPRFDLEHPAAVGSPDGLRSEQRHGCQRGERQQSTTECLNTGTEVHTVYRVQVACLC